MSKVVFFVAGARPFQKMVSRGRRSTPDVSCCEFFASRIVRAASSGDNDNVQIPWQAWLFVTCAEN